MFLKPFRVKTKTSMKGSDRKKLCVDIQNQFPTLTSAQIAELIPGKGDMTQVKIATHSDEHLLVYCFQNVPLIYESFKKIYPTVYTLWKFPELLPVFTTYQEVFPRLANGADLMLPGVLLKGKHHPQMFGSLMKGDLCTICLKGNKAPIALGEALLSGEDMYMSAMKGKGVKIIHIFGDQLWEFGNKSQPPNIPDTSYDDLPDEDNSTDCHNLESLKITTESCSSLDPFCLESSESGMDSESNVAVAADEKRERDISSGDRKDEAGCECGVTLSENSDQKDNQEVNDTQGEANRILNLDDMDELLLYCFKCAIKGHVKKGDLPLLTSTFLKAHLQPFCPVGKHLDVKKSSYKKFSCFLSQMQTEGYIKLTEVSKGVDSITDIDRSHPELKGIVVPDLSSKENQDDVETDEDFVPPEVTEVWFVTAVSLPLLGPLGFAKGDYLTASDLKQQVTNFVKTNNLQAEDNKSQVRLDPVLKALTLNRNEGEVELLSWNELMTRITEKLQIGFSIAFPGKPCVLKKGKIKPIKLDVIQRGSKKRVTTVENLEEYGVDPRLFAYKVQHGVACSASVVSSEQKGHGQEVVVQGNQINFIAELLLDKYKIPKKYIQGLEKAPKAKHR